MMPLVVSLISWLGQVWRGGCQTVDTILHLGAHRSASTTYQAFLEGNAQRLSAMGVAAWTPQRTRAGLFSGLVRRPQDVTIQIARQAERSSGLIRLEIERLRQQGYAQLIVSEENMIGAARNNFRSRAFYPDLDDRLIRFRDAFAEACTQIVITIRSYEGFWASSLAYSVAQGGRLPDAGMLERLVRQPRRWRDVITETAQTFPHARVIVLPFERFAGRPEAQFEIMTGVAPPLSGMVGLTAWRNPSPRLDHLRQVVSSRMTGQLAKLLPEGEGRWMPFDRDQRHALDMAYKADMTWLRRGAEGFAQLIEDPDGPSPDQQMTRARQGDADAPLARPQRGQRYEGPSRAMV